MLAMKIVAKCYYRFLLQSLFVRSTHLVGFGCVLKHCRTYRTLVDLWWPVERNSITSKQRYRTESIYKMKGYCGAARCTSCVNVTTLSLLKIDDLIFGVVKLMQMENPL